MKRDNLAALAIIAALSAAAAGVFMVGREAPAVAAVAPEPAVNPPAQRVSRVVTRADFAAWPFKTDSVELACEPGQALSIRYPQGARFGLNIPGRARHQPLDSWALAPGAGEADLRPLIDAGLKLCPADFAAR